MERKWMNFRLLCTNLQSYYYEVDAEQTKHLKATDGLRETQSKDHKDLTATVQVLEPSTLSTAGVEEKNYAGWNLKEIVINGTKINELPSTVEDGTVIVYYYEASTTTRYTVEVYYEYEGKYSSVRVRPRLWLAQPIHRQS